MEAPTSLSRRGFVIGLGSLAAASLFEMRCTQSAAVRFGYAAITWGDVNALQAVADIGAAGYRGVQLRSPILKDFGDKPKELADLLKQHKLEFVALSGGGPRNDYVAADEIDTQVRHATFLRDAGGLYLQMTDSARPKGRKPEPDDFRALGSLLTEVGKRTTDLGIPVAYHNHMGSLGEGPDEVDALMDAS